MAYEKIFKADKKAWAFFQAQPSGYKRTIMWWVLSAKKPETQARRLAQLIAAAANAKRINLLTGKPES